MKAIKDWQRLAHATAVEKGFYENRDKTDPTWDACRLMKIVAELAECYEEVKSGSQSYLYYPEATWGTPKPYGLGIELADVLLFVFDFAESKNIDLEQMLEVKSAWNQTRPRMHGKVL